MSFISLDLIGSSLSIASTYYFTKAFRIAWGVGFLAILINGILYWQKGVYGHFLLEIVYGFSTFYGWYQWTYGATQKKSPLAIRSLTYREMGGYVCLVSVAIASTAVLLRALGSDVPYWDASTTCLSFLAQWLTCLKYVECWIIWFFADALMAALDLYKGIPFHSATHSVYLFFAVLGYYRWLKILRSRYVEAL